MLTAVGLLVYLRHVASRLHVVREEDSGAASQLLRRGGTGALDTHGGGTQGLVDELMESDMADLAEYELKLHEEARALGMREDREEEEEAEEQEEPERGEAKGRAAGRGDDKSRVATAAHDGRAGVAPSRAVAAPARAADAPSRASHAALVPADGAAPTPRHKALIFTMDGIADYVAHSRAGGPAGEIIVRESLEWGLRQLGVEPVVAGSDAEFARLSASPEDFALFFLDPWTFVDPGAHIASAGTISGWVRAAAGMGSIAALDLHERRGESCRASYTRLPSSQSSHGEPSPQPPAPTPLTHTAAPLPGWTPRKFLVSRESRSFMLSFFGAREAGHGWQLPPRHILTPFPVAGAGNSFLGYAQSARWLPRGASEAEVAAAAGGAWGGVIPRRLPAKLRQGVLWGKKPEYFAGREALIAAIAQLAPLHATAVGLAGIAGVVTHGHLDREQWHELLAESKFLIGMGA